MIHQEAGVPSPANRLAMFRIGRVDDGVKSIAATAQRFREAVDAALGDSRESDSTKAVTKAFVASYQAFSESLESARTGGLVKGATIDVLESIMKKLKAEYADGLASLRGDVGRLEQRGPASMKEFCAAASDKIDRLEQFWQTTYQHAPKMKM
ncbi:hypothetical protein SAMN03159335_06177 [Burkholderia cepacia]|uniref:hypothetical protein n=1 Tax=Burkholderia cepacia TaxID=292 RepID=UPI0008C5B33F|nr:hypothetical protein [Burkholderia cepacia]SEU40071.1 hypothetical protein SAMN03159335_06177 [Burkholderia cepacia]